MKGMTIDKDYYEKYGKELAGKYDDIAFAKVGEVDHEKQKITATVEMFGRETAAELGFDQIDTF